MAKSIKRDQFQQQIQNEVNKYLRTGLNNTTLTFVSITKVELNKDYSIATLYWDTFDPSKRGSIKEALEKSLGKIRTHLAKTLNVRHTPSLEATYDSQFEDEQSITDLLNKEKGDGKGY